MKKIYFIIIGMFLAIGLQAQVEKTLENTAGNLNTLLSSTELATITDLTITGTLDARDFKTMRDSMPVLSVVDIGATSIIAYEEEVYFVLYPANTIPSSDPTKPSVHDYSFSDKTSLTSVILPATVTAIGSEAFRGCTGLISVEFPGSLTTISGGAFKGCTSLLSIELPSSLTVMGWESFLNCSSLVSVTIPSSMNYVARSTFSGCTSLKTIVIPSSVTEIRAYAFYNCISLETVAFTSSLVTIEDYSFSRCRSLSAVTIPTSVKSIGISAFSECSSLSKIIIPRTLKRMDIGAFSDCINLRAIYDFHVNPLELPDSNTGVFGNVDKTNSTLFIPAGTKELYTSALQWKDFQNMVEMPLFMLPDTSVIMRPDQPTATFDMDTNEDWTANTDQSWLTISPLSGTGSQTFTLTAENNSSPAIRTAIIKISISDSISQEVTVVQKGVPVEINVAQAGTLASQLLGIELKTISELVITGELDARDFVVIRDQTPLLEVLDLRGASIKAYSGTGGTFSYLSTWDYPADELPDFALEDAWETNRKVKLTNLYLPETCTSVGREALSRCIGLKEVIFPPSVVNIGFMAFSGCTSLKSIHLPSVTTIIARAFEECRSLVDIHMPAVTHIGKQAFMSCYKLSSVILPNTLTTIEEEVFSMCLDLRSVELGNAITKIGQQAFFECHNLRSIIIPPSVKSIELGAFAACSRLSVISIPASIETIGSDAFSSCDSLKSVYSYSNVPPDLGENPTTFSNSNTTTSTLYVPAGSKVLYAAAEGWKDFLNIVEMAEFSLSATELSMEADPTTRTINIITEGEWTVRCDKEWLTVNPGNGTGDHELTFLADANPEDTARIAIVTVSAAGMEDQTITVTQQGIVTEAAETAQNRPSINCYPNPFTEKMTIEIQNLKKESIAVDIYNMAGQRVKSLTIGNRAERISLSWDGSNEQGQKVPHGMYLLKMNEVAWQMVKGK